MNRLLPFIAFLLLTTPSVEAQRLKLFRSIIYTAQGERIDGILYDMTDSTVQIVPNQVVVFQQLHNGEVPTVYESQWQDMNRIIIRRKGRVGRGLLIGGGIGLAVGIGLIASIPSSGGISGALEGLALAVAGVASPVAGLISGGVVGATPNRVYRINRDWIAYRNAKASLKWLSVAAQRRVRAADSINP